MATKTADPTGRLLHLYYLQYRVFACSDGSAVREARRELRQMHATGDTKDAESLAIALAHEIARTEHTGAACTRLSNLSALSATPWLAHVPRTPTALLHCEVPVDAVAAVHAVFGARYEIGAPSTDGRVRLRSTATDVVDDCERLAIATWRLSVGWGKMLSEHYRKQPLAAAVTPAPPPTLPRVPGAPPRKKEAPAPPAPIDVTTVREKLAEQRQAERTRTPIAQPPRAVPPGEEVARRIRALKHVRTGELLPQPVRDAFMDLHAVGTQATEGFNEITEHVWTVLFEEFGASEHQLEKLSRAWQFMLDASQQITDVGDLYGSKMVVVLEAMRQAAGAVNTIVHDIALSHIRATGVADLKMDVHTDAEVAATALLETLRFQRDELTDEIGVGVVEPAVRSGKLAADTFANAPELLDTFGKHARGTIQYLAAKLMETARMTEDERDWLLSMFDSFVAQMRASPDFQADLAEHLRLIGVPLDGFRGATRLMTWVYFLLYALITTWMILAQMRPGTLGAVSRTTPPLQGLMDAAGAIRQGRGKHRADQELSREDQSFDWKLLRFAVRDDIDDARDDIMETLSTNATRRLRTELDESHAADVETSVDKADDYAARLQRRNMLAATMGGEMRKSDRAWIAFQENMDELVDTFDSVNRVAQQMLDSVRRVASAHFANEPAMKDWATAFLPATTRALTSGVTPQDTHGMMQNVIARSLGVPWEKLTAVPHVADIMHKFLEEMEPAVRDYSTAVLRWERDLLWLPAFLEQVTKAEVNLRQLLKDAIQTAGDKREIMRLNTESASKDMDRFAANAQIEANATFARELVFHRVLEHTSYARNVAASTSQSLWSQLLATNKYEECAGVIGAARVNPVTELFEYIKHSLSWKTEDLPGGGARVAESEFAPSGLSPTVNSTSCCCRPASAAGLLGMTLAITRP